MAGWMGRWQTDRLKASWMKEKKDAWPNRCAWKSRKTQVDIVVTGRCTNGWGRGLVGRWLDLWFRALEDGLMMGGRRDSRAGEEWVVGLRPRSWEQALSEEQVLRENGRSPGASD